MKNMTQEEFNAMLAEAERRMNDPLVQAQTDLQIAILVDSDQEEEARSLLVQLALHNEDGDLDDLIIETVQKEALRREVANEGIAEILARIDALETERAEG